MDSMIEFFIWIKLFFFLRKERKEQEKLLARLKTKGVNITKPSIENYSKEFQSAMSRVFGYKRSFTRMSIIIFLVNDILTEIEVYHSFFNAKGANHNLDICSDREKIQEYMKGYYGLTDEDFKP